MKPYFTTTLAYLAFGCAWILLSDRAVEIFLQDPAAVARAQSLKGLVFVALSSLLILNVSRQLHLRDQQREAEKARLYRQTMQAVQHVLRNFLNQIQVVTLEAEDTPDFDPETLDLAQRTICEAEESIAELSALQDLSERSLEGFVAANLGSKPANPGAPADTRSLEVSGYAAVE